MAASQLNTDPPWLADGSVVKEQTDPKVYVIYGRALFWIPSPEELFALGFDWSRVQTLPDGSLANVSRIPQWGTLLRARDQAPVYYTLTHAPSWMFGGGILLWIPSPEALTALGFSWQQVHVVPAGSLDGFPKSSLLSDPKTGSPLMAPGQTLGSFLFPPGLGNWWDPPQAKWFPRLEVPGLTLPNGARVTEMRGWLIEVDHNPNDPCGEADWHLWLEPDPVWLDRIGVDWTTFVKVGDILDRPDNNTLPPIVASPDFTSCAAVPHIKMEVCGWPTKNWPTVTQGKPAPADWTISIAFQGCTTRWPFQPDHDSLDSTQALSPGDYVRVIGSIVTDDPHDEFGDWQDAYPGETNSLIHPPWKGHDELNPARWTEIHPPDIIQKLPDPGRTVRLYGVAVVARATGLDLGGKDQSCTATLPAPPQPAPNMYLSVREIVGAETFVNTITEGNASRTGAQITINADSVTVHVAVHGQPFGGSPGHFKAVYLLSWETTPPPPPRQLRTPTVEVNPFPVPMGKFETINVLARDPVDGTALTGTTTILQPSVHSGRVRFDPVATINVPGSHTVNIQSVFGDGDTHYPHGHFVPDRASEYQAVDYALVLES